MMAKLITMGLMAAAAAVATMYVILAKESKGEGYGADVSETESKKEAKKAS